MNNQRLVGEFSESRRRLAGKKATGIASGCKRGSKTRAFPLRFPLNMFALVAFCATAQAQTVYTHTTTINPTEGQT
jgi:hypothetical protein